MGWSDSNWAQDPDDHCSTSRFVFNVAGSSISWSSKKQQTIATLSVETEYVASANATREAMWLHILLTELDFPPTTTTIIFADNQGCIALASNLVLHSQVKHINIQHHFIWEHVECQEVGLHYISTKEMVADIFTKALPKDSFKKFQTELGVLLLVSQLYQDQ